MAPDAEGATGTVAPIATSVPSSAPRALRAPLLRRADEVFKRKASLLQKATEDISPG
jgi:hypothetical protein